MRRWRFDKWGGRRGYLVMPGAGERVKPQADARREETTGGRRRGRDGGRDKGTRGPTRTRRRRRNEAGVRIVMYCLMLADVTGSSYSTITVTTEGIKITTYLLKRNGPWHRWILMSSKVPKWTFATLGNCRRYFRRHPHKVPFVMEGRRFVSSEKRFRQFR